MFAKVARANLDAASRRACAGFHDLAQDWIAALFEHPNLLRMGHAQRTDDQNLGLGWLYYALARIVRPTTVVVIGSFRGFAPLVFARALADNAEGGQLHFIDPSLVDDFWKDAAAVRAYFGELRRRRISSTTA